MQQSDIRRRLFERGVAAVANLLPECAGNYICPVCGECFDLADLQAGRLTGDHVPPKSLGGRLLVLTCKSCNNSAGYGVDAHLAGEAEALRFGSSEMKQPMGIRFTVAGKSINADVLMTGNSILITGDEKRNHPYAQGALLEQLAHQVNHPGDGNLKFGIHAEFRFAPRKASLGWLRAAFLVAFAAFGYRYALSPGLLPVRQQLRNPDAELIRTFGLINPADEGYHLRLVDEPTWARSLVIVLRRHSIFLPWHNELDLYDRLDLAARNHPSRTPIELHFDAEIAWPKTTNHLMDLAESSPVSRLRVPTSEGEALNRSELLN